MALIKSISGIRGTIGGVPGESLTAIDIVKFTASFGNIIAERRKDGDYKDPFDFIKRINQRAVNKRTLESLINAGAELHFTKVSDLQSYLLGKH